MIDPIPLVAGPLRLSFILSPAQFVAALPAAFFLLAPFQPFLSPAQTIGADGHLPRPWPRPLYRRRLFGRPSSLPSLPTRPPLPLSPLPSTPGVNWKGLMSPHWFSWKR